MNQFIKSRREESANYSAVFFNGKTIRIPLDPTKPITELQYPEFYDISLGNKCETGKCPNCVIPGSLIETIRGQVSIEDIKIGDVVYTNDIINHTNTPNSVTQLHITPYNGMLISIELENGKVLNITPNHKIYTSNRGWVSAENLDENDNILNFD